LDQRLTLEKAMRTLFTLTAGVVLIGGLTLAANSGVHKSPAKVIAEKLIAEKIDGKDSKATTVEVTLEPGQSSPPHRHPGPVFGYVLEGAYEWAVNDQPARRLKAGDTFYEPTMSLHRVSRNPSEKGKTRVLAVLLLPRDAKHISIPEKGE
jgi:quercetin dioxygenase-like cupin family protein